MAQIRMTCMLRNIKNTGEELMVGVGNERI